MPTPPRLSDTRLEQFRLDLENIGTPTLPYVVSAQDYQVIMPALASGANPPLPRLPQRARCILLRKLRSLVEDFDGQQLNGGQQTTPGAYFDFPEARTGVIQLASVPGRVWSSFHSFTFVMWIWFPRKIHKSSPLKSARQRVSSSLETTLPQDALLFSLSTPTAIGVEGRMKERPSSTSRRITLELRSIDPISTRTTTLKTSVASTSVQSNRWHLLAVTHSSLSSGNDDTILNSCWYLDGKPLPPSSDSVHVPYPKLQASDSLSNCLVGGRFSGNIGGFGLYGGELSHPYLKELYVKGPNQSIPSISVCGPLPRFATTAMPNKSGSSEGNEASGGKRGKKRKNTSLVGGGGLPPTKLPVVFWYNACHLSDRSQGTTQSFLFFVVVVCLCLLLVLADACFFGNIVFWGNFRRHQCQSE